MGFGEIPDEQVHIIVKRRLDFQFIHRLMEAPIVFCIQISGDGSNTGVFVNPNGVGVGTDATDRPLTIQPPPQGGGYSDDLNIAGFIMAYDGPTPGDPTTWELVVGNTTGATRHIRAYVNCAKVQ